MNRILAVAAICLLFISCGPVYRTNYSFSPPESSTGKACVFQCENSKLQCQQIRDMERERCLDRADRDYYRCEEDNRYRSRKEKVSCYRSYCSDADYERCEEAYRTCYQSCGGQVTSSTVCVANCEQVR